MKNQIKTLVISFKNELKQAEIGRFRGAVIDATENAGVLFHNHLEDEKFRYSYPLIQYKRIRKRAAIVCVGEGTEAIGDFFSSCNFEIEIGERPVLLEVDAVKASQTMMQVWEDEFTYHIRKWLPLNSENYERYKQIDSLADKYSMLENMLTGNILSMAKGVGVQFDKQVMCKITEIGDPRLATYKGVRLTSFDAEFKTNVSLPDYVGLGKGVSQGFGTVVRKREKRDSE